MFIVFASNLLFTCMPASAETEGDLVGVEAGDWVKYKVTRLGVANFAWFHMHAVWLKVEVLNVSDTVVTYRETVHYDDGDEYVSTGLRDVQYDSDRANYLVAAELEPGDKIGEKVIPTMEEPNEFVTINLTITDSENRSYGRVTREANAMKFHWVTPFFTDIANFTIEEYWDKHTGFLLERKAMCYLLGYPELSYNETNPASTCVMGIADTNMWQMQTGEFFLWSLAVAIPIAAVTVAIVAIKLKNNRRKNEIEEK
jgi:hypothetical protein